MHFKVRHNYKGIELLDRYMKDISDINLPEIRCIQKTGEERLSFLGSDAGCCLLDFWKWCGSNVLSNAVRGKFAEFIVGMAENRKAEEWTQKVISYRCICK